MITGHVIAVVFRLINFGVVIGLIAYLFKTRILPVVSEKIKERVNQSQMFKHQQEELAQRHQQLLKELATDEQVALQLKSRIDSWARAVAQENKERIAYEEQQRLHVQKQVAYRTLERMRAKAYEEVTCAAITQVKKDMMHKLSNEKMSKDYFAHLINSLAMREK